MNDRHRSLSGVPPVSLYFLTATALALCSSCTTPPDPDDGLLGILYQAATRPEAGRLSGKTAAREGAPESMAPDAQAAPSTNGALASLAACPYRLSPGDVLTVSYFPRPSGDVEEYLLESLDVVTVSVAGQETYTADVPVRPDGCISFFLVGDLRVRGRTVAQVRTAIAEHLAKTMSGAEVTVILKQGNALAREFLDTLRSNTDQGSTRVILIRQDGTVTFPLIGETMAMGKTLRDLSRETEERYDRVFRGGISLALNLNSSADGNIAVLGEVRNPGRYTVVNPVSPFFALAMAGGALDTAKKTQVVVVKRLAGGRTAWHSVNLDLDSGKPLGPEIALAPQDMLLVPKSGVANLNLFVDQYIRGILPVSVGYSSGSWQYTAPR